MVIRGALYTWSSALRCTLGHPRCLGHGFRVSCTCLVLEPVQTLLGYVSACVVNFLYTQSRSKHTRRSQSTKCTQPSTWLLAALLSVHGLYPSAHLTPCTLPSVHSPQCGCSRLYKCTRPRSAHLTPCALPSVHSLGITAVMLLTLLSLEQLYARAHCSTSPHTSNTLAARSL